MKLRFQFIAGSSIAALMWLGAVAVYSAPPEKKAGADAQLTGSNAIPQSVFTVPTTPKEGRDPFFPNARYLYGGPIVKTRPLPGADLLVLNGISGSADHKLAMINGRTVAEGEEAEVSTASGRVKLRCVEIKGESAVVEVSGERKELHLRSSE
jgi:hypothetical protein